MRIGKNFLLLLHIVGRAYRLCVLREFVVIILRNLFGDALCSMHNVSALNVGDAHGYDLIGIHAVVWLVGQFITTNFILLFYYRKTTTDFAAK